MTPNQIKKARTLLAIAKIAEDNKEQLVASFTESRTVSLSQMDYPETQELFKYLEKLTGQPESQLDKMKRKILSLAHEMKWHVPGTRKLDMIRINDWCADKFKAALDDLYYLDLTKAVTAFTKVHIKYLKGI